MTLCDQLAAFFRARPNVWIPAQDLFFAGSMAWRSRIADVRREYDMQIENKVFRVRLPDGRVITKSSYRYVTQEDIGPNQPPREWTLRP